MFALIDGPSIPVATSPKTHRIRDPPADRARQIVSLASAFPQSLDSSHAQSSLVIFRIDKSAGPADRHLFSCMPASPTFQVRRIATPPKLPPKRTMDRIGLRLTMQI
jgi:hypothetical protein